MSGEHFSVSLAAAAAWYAKNLSWRVFPCHSIAEGRCTCGKPECEHPAKHPRTTHGVKNASTDPAVIAEWWRRWPESNIGLATGVSSGVDVLDVDPRAGGDDTLQDWKAKHGELPATIQSLTGGGGIHYFFRHTPGLKNSAGKVGAGLDFRVDGGYVILPPSKHISGRAYCWEGAARPDEIAAISIPAFLLKLARGSSNGNGRGRARPIAASIPGGQRNATLTRLAGVARRKGSSVAAITAYLLAENMERCTPPLAEAEVRAIAESVARYEPAEPEPDPPLPDEPTQPESEVPEFSEDALAARFTKRHAEDLRYVAAWGRWLHWNGMRWIKDDTLHVFDRAREICRVASVECSDWKISTRVSSAATVAAVERLVRADRQHAAVVDQWDSDPWLLNTPGGIVDLRTGSIEAHRREDYCTKLTAASPGGPCPRWDTFLDRVTGGDRELQSFLKRMVGYCLTADIREHALFFLYGTGANGKSVFLNTITGILNDYSKSAAIETFIASSAEHHPTDLAGLQGARLVSAVETEDGRRWAESKVKALTGGDKIAARFMRQDFFEFTPVFKLVIAGNHKPGLRSVDEAIRRRLHLVPFTVTIPPIERDLSLSLKLRSEWSGILGWAVGGCLEWQGRGLNPPASVRDATEAYMASEDGVAQWLDAHCVQLPKVLETSERLFADWKTWAESAGEYVGSQKRFSQTLEERGFKRVRDTKGNRAFQGIGLRVADGGGQS